MRHIEALEGRRLLSGYSYVIGQTFVGTTHHEAMELLSIRRRVYVGCMFERGTTDARLNRCAYVGFDHCKFLDPVGRADPDGDEIQWINCVNCWATHCTFVASARACDLASAYFDVQTPGMITIAYSDFIGAGNANFSNSICLDGSAGGKLDVHDCGIWNARAGITVASGVATVDRVRFVGCPVQVYVASLYHRPSLLLIDDPRGVLLGDGGAVREIG